MSSVAGWKNTVRHNLAVKAKFTRIPHENPTRSGWWVLVEGQEAQGATGGGGGHVDAVAEVEKEKVIGEAMQNCCRPPNID